MLEHVGTGHPPAAVVSSPPTPDTGVLRVLLVEDDEGDALLFTELLADADLEITAQRARSIAEAERLWEPSVDCVVLDLGLPDTTGLEGMQRLLSRGARALVVLTGFDDERQGAAAVAAGAQDYLIKGHIDGRALSRVISYAVHRVKAEAQARELVSARAVASEQARLSRGLLPSPLLQDPRVGFGAAYLPGGGRLLLGGDFYDAVQGTDGTVWAILGDVCGHGPDEAALGVGLRFAWRTLVMAGHPEAEIFPSMQRLLMVERHLPELFATACMVVLSPDRRHLRCWLAGHPVPLLVSPGWADPSEPVPQLPLGIDPEQQWTPTQLELPPRWWLLMHTDGLVEGRDGRRHVVLEAPKLAMILAAQLAESGPDAEPDVVLRHLLERVRGHVPQHDDDLAVMLLTHRPRNSAEPRSVS